MTFNNNVTGQSAHDKPTTNNQLPAPSNSDKCSSATRVSQANIPRTALPAARTFFDPWNSSSTGHQRAENRLSGSTGWRDSRNLKLTEQYKGGLSGGKRIADTIGAGSEDFGKDGRKANGGWEPGAKGLRTGGQKSLMETWSASKTGKKLPSEKETELTSVAVEQNSLQAIEETDSARESETSSKFALEEDVQPNNIADTNSPPGGRSSNPTEKQIFTGLCFYINGSTAPLVSDHKLRHLLAAHGAKHSISLGRRSVTHVVLSTANTNGGVGGGLAASKIQKEVTRTGGKAVKFITAEW